MGSVLDTRQGISFKPAVLGTECRVVLSQIDKGLGQNSLGVILVATKVSSATLLGWLGTSLEFVASVLVNVHGPATSAPFVPIAWTDTVASGTPDSLGPLSNVLATEALGSSLNTRKWVSILSAVPGTFHWGVLATCSVCLWQNPPWVILEATKMLGAALGRSNFT